MSIRSKTNVIGVLVPSITNLFFPLVINGIQNYLSPLGYSLHLNVTEGDPDLEVELCEDMINRDVDGLISVDPLPENNSYFEELSLDIPLILINGSHKGVHCNFVLNDQAEGAEKAFAYLYELGHKNIGFIRGLKSFSYDIKEKVYYSVMREHNLDILPNNMILLTFGNSVETSDLAAKAVATRLQESNPPTAFFACNDWMAIGALNAAKSLGLSVPEDLSIIGFDNICITEISSPKLTSVDQNMFNLGVEAATSVCRLIDYPTEPLKSNLVKTSLIIRESCAVAKNTL